MPQCLEREFTDHKFCGSNPTSTSRLPFSRLWQPGDIPAPVLPSGGMTARHRKGVSAGFKPSFNILTRHKPSYELPHSTRSDGEDESHTVVAALLLLWIPAIHSQKEKKIRLVSAFGHRTKLGQNMRKKKKKAFSCSAFRCLSDMPPEGSTRAGILPDCPSLDRGSRKAEVGFESRTFRSVNSRSNHLGHLAPKTCGCDGTRNNA
ncbi:hypothetical protein T265_04095 [Opisthorchis viverrini]|uniref:Uncharacterized protein n=1 Tax=Opisthorchis viverrini TaxID=6198 RepID=A0A075AH07_OPIVI|nr:hypothetical protein T265_04095 [Opisthorchis viverrini]KER29249.1 hypothetical protein T265_04095 [Opisthorchis viverrini]